MPKKSELRYAYRETIRSIRKLPGYRLKAAIGRSVRWHGVPVRALRRSELLALVGQLVLESKNQEPKKRR